MKFRLFRRLTLFGPRWYFRLVGRNGEPIAQSEGYRNRGDAESTIMLIKASASAAKVVPGE